MKTNTFTTPKAPVNPWTDNTSGARGDPVKFRAARKHRTFNLNVFNQMPRNFSALFVICKYNTYCALMHVFYYVIVFCLGNQTYRF